MTEEFVAQYVLDEQKSLTEAMKKSGRTDFWYSDIETAIVRAVDKERKYLLQGLLDIATINPTRLIPYIREQLNKES